MAWTRRDILRFGLSGAALSFLGAECPDGGGSTPPDPDPDVPVYELTDGTTLYDDFDGNGNLQTYDGKSLAEAGRFSQKLWVVTPGCEVIEGAGGRLLAAAADDSGLRVEYRPTRPGRGELARFLAGRGWGATSWDRRALAAMLDERVRPVVSGLELGTPETRTRVFRYLMDAGTDALNPRGRALAAALSAGRSAPRPEEISSILRPLGFDDGECALAARLAADVRMFRAARPVSSAAPPRSRLGGPAAPRRPAEPFETAYMFSPDGALAGAAPHVSGYPYRSTRRWTGPAGEIAAVARPGGGSGHVVRMINGDRMSMRLSPDNPGAVGFADIRSFSADVCLSSESTAPLLFAGLDDHTTIPEQPPAGKSWFADIGIRRTANGDVFLFSWCCNVNTGYDVFRPYGPAELDRWYNVRVDAVTRARDPRLGEKEIRFDFYVDGTLRSSEIPEDSPILLTPSRLGFGPRRNLAAAMDGGFGACVAYFDNVRAVYRDRVR